MRAIIALLLILALTMPALAQWTDRERRHEDFSYLLPPGERWQEEIPPQELELQRQRQEMDWFHRLRDAEAERDRLQMEQHDLDRGATTNFRFGSPLKNAPYSQHQR